MNRKSILQKLFALTLLALFVLGLSTPAQAFTPMAGERIVIEEGEVIEDDLYVSANTFILKGTVKGDLIVVGSVVRIDSSGVVTGDLIAAGQGIVIEGRVEDDVRVAGMVVVISGEVGDDLVTAGYNIDVQRKAQVGGDVVVMGAQVSLDGVLAGNAQVNGEAVALLGEIGGDASISTGKAGESPPFSPFQFMPQSPDMPQAAAVPPGLTFGPEARVAGNFNYTAPVESAVPGGVVGGQVSYNTPPPSEEKPTEEAQTPATRAIQWLLDWLRSLATLLIVGLILAYLAPAFLLDSVEAFKRKPLPSFFWGIVAIVGFGLGLILLSTAVLILVVVLGIMTLFDLVTAVVMIGIWLGFGLILAYKLLAAYVAKIVICTWFGLWVLGRLRPALERNRLWPLVLGVAVFTLLWAIPYLGGLVNLIVILLGLGALIQLGRDWLKQMFTQRPPADAPPLS